VVPAPLSFGEVPAPTDTPVPPRPTDMKVLHETSIDCDVTDFFTTGWSDSARWGSAG
jgi:hypothetical protein